MVHGMPALALAASWPGSAAELLEVALHVEDGQALHRHVHNYPVRCGYLRAAQVVDGCHKPTVQQRCSSAPGGAAA